MANKYGARKTQVNGILFDSKREANRYRELLLMQRAGIVKEIELQPQYVLIDKFKHKRTGKVIQPIKYTADFLVTYPDGHQEIEDAKGAITRDYALRKKLFYNRYPELEIKEV